MRFICMDSLTKNIIGFPRAVNYRTANDWVSKKDH